MVGEIHLANIYFTDASASKVRPILLIKPNSFGDIIYLPLTSNLQTKGISIDNRHLKDGFLPKTSIVVHEKPSVIAQSLIIKKIGTLNSDVFNSIINELSIFLKAGI